MSTQSNTETTVASMLGGHMQRVTMYFHTTLRNIGLYTSISLATLVCSYQFIKNTSSFHDVNQLIYKMISLLVLLTSACFLTIAVMISRNLQHNVNRELRGYSAKSLHNSWLNLIRFITVCHFSIYLVIAGVFYMHFLK